MSNILHSSLPLIIINVQCFAVNDNGSDNGGRNSGSCSDTGSNSGIGSNRSTYSCSCSCSGSSILRNVVFPVACQKNYQEVSHGSSLITYSDDIFNFDILQFDFEFDSKILQLKFHAERM